MSMSVYLMGLLGDDDLHPLGLSELFKVIGQALGQGNLGRKDKDFFVVSGQTEIDQLLRDDDVILGDVKRPFLLQGPHLWVGGTDDDVGDLFPLGNGPGGGLKIVLKGTDHGKDLFVP